MRTILPLFLSLLLSGCALLTQAPSPEAPPAPFAQAELLFKQGKYVEAHDEYRRISAADPASPAGEEASYRAALVLISSHNPAKNYTLAGREFDAYLKQYPSGKFSEDASTWLDALEVVRQSGVAKLREQVDALTTRSQAMSADLRNAQSERDAAKRERDSLHAERDQLEKQIEALGKQKDDLLRTNKALQQERDGLAKDKTALEKKVAALAQEKEHLAAAKARLDKRLRDVTAADVKMEKERKKIK